MGNQQENDFQSLAVVKEFESEYWLQYLNINSKGL
jgi:hypothetical protein